MTRFDSAIAVTASGDGRYTADLDPGYIIGSAMNGGYLMAVAQAATLAESPHPHAISSSFHFLRPATGGPARCDVTVLKPGRTVTTLQVTVAQDERPVAVATLATGELTPDAAPEHEAPPPLIPPIERCRQFDPRSDMDPAMEFPRRVDQFYTPETWERLRGRAAEPEPELAGHVRPSEGDGGPGADPCAFLPLAVDALPPVVSAMGSWRWAPTVELTWHMRGVPEPGALTFLARAGAVSDGWFDETVDLWDVKGRLVAQSRQLARTGR